VSLGVEDLEVGRVDRGRVEGRIDLLCLERFWRSHSSTAAAVTFFLGSCRFVVNNRNPVEQAEHNERFELAIGDANYRKALQIKSKSR
jgi:hypothetical protein